MDQPARLVFGCAAALPVILAAQASAQLAGSVIARSLVSAGDQARISRVLLRARRGERFTIGVIGGSITAGAAATSPDRCYGALIARWWRETFPKATVDFVNAGIGATGSNYGALRAERDLLSHNPDFVVVECSVNDPNNQEAAESLEGLIRQILKQPQKPAVVLLFMMSQGGNNSQEWHSKVGSHYRLPMVSFRDALWPEMEAGRMKWEEMIADAVHPNDRGHAAAAGFVTAMLQSALAELPADAPLPRIPPIPKALISDAYEHVTLLEALDLKPVRNDGWTYDAALKCWKSDRPGSVMELMASGRIPLIMEWRQNGPFGMVRVQVDDLPPAVRDSWFDQTWGWWRGTAELARDLKPGPHRVRIELLPDKNPQSEGHEYRLLGLGIAGR